MAEVEKADFERCRSRVIGLLNVGDEDDAYYGDIAEFGEFTEEEIRDAILEGDTIICTDIISNPAHSFRNAFIATDAPTELDSGDPVPPYMGASDKVECKLTAGGVWTLGRQLRNISRFNAIEADTELPASVRQRYYVRESGRIHSCADKLRVYVPELPERDENSRTLNSPINYERGVIAWAIAGLWKDTTERATHDFYLRQAVMFSVRAAGGETNLPEVEKYRRKEG